MWIAGTYYFNKGEYKMASATLSRYECVATCWLVSLTRLTKCFAIQGVAGMTHGCSGMSDHCGNSSTTFSAYRRTQRQPLPALCRAVASR